MIFASGYVPELAKHPNMKKITALFFALISTLIIQAQHDSAYNDANRLMVIVEGKIGYIDSTGKMAISPAFPLGSQFSQGAASVVHISNGAYRYAFINDNMDIIIPTMFDAAGDFTEGMARVQLRGKWGYINKKGNWVIEPAYNLCYEFNEGHAQAAQKNKWGIIDKKAKWVIAPLYQDITKVNEGVFAAQEKMGSSWKFYNLKGELVLKDSFDRAGSFSQGLAPVRNSEGKWGFINKKGQTIIPFQYSSAYEFSANGLACVEKNGYWGFINTKGEVVIEFQYSRGARFRYNYALVEKGNILGYINSKGEYIWQTEQ